MDWSMQSETLTIPRCPSRLLTVRAVGTACAPGPLVNTRPHYLFALSRNPTVLSGLHRWPVPLPLLTVEFSAWCRCAPIDTSHLPSLALPYWVHATLQHHPTRQSCSLTVAHARKRKLGPTVGNTWAAYCSAMAPRHRPPTRTSALRSRRHRKYAAGTVQPKIRLLCSTLGCITITAATRGPVKAEPATTYRRIRSFNSTIQHHGHAAT